MTHGNFIVTAVLRVGAAATEDVELSMRLTRLLCEYFKEKCKFFGNVVYVYMMCEETFGGCW